MASISITDNVPVGFTCFWRIKDFQYCSSSPTLLLKSQIFKVEFDRIYQFRLEIRNQKEFLNLHLFRILPESSHLIQFSMSILTSSGWLTIIRSSEIETKTDCNDYVKYDLIEWNKIYDCKDEYLPNDCLTISCHIWNLETKILVQQVFLSSRMVNRKSLIHKRVRKHSSLKPSDFIYIRAEIISNQESEIKGNSNVLNNKDVLLRKLNEEGFCYVTLRTANKDFAVYKAILSTSSPVFYEMFQNDMTDKNVIDIKDVDSETMHLLLQFLHLNSLDRLKWKAIARLYYAANKYQIEQLKKECSILLKSQLTTENFCEFLVISDMHQDENENLKLVAKEHFCKNWKVILRSKSWKEFILRKPELTQEMLLALADQL